MSFYEKDVLPRPLTHYTTWKSNTFKQKLQMFSKDKIKELKGLSSGILTCRVSAILWQFIHHSMFFLLVTSADVNFGFQDFPFSLFISLFRLPINAIFLQVQYGQYNKTLCCAVFTEVTHWGDFINPC